MNKEIIDKIEEIIEIREKKECDNSKRCISCKYMNICETLDKLEYFIKNI